MGKRKAEQPHSDPQGPTDNGPDKITSQPGPTEPLPAGLARIESPDLVPPQAEQARAPPATPIEQPTPAMATVDPSLPGAASAKPAITKLDDVRPGTPEARSATASASTSWAKARRLTPLAASIAIAAAVGAMAGSMATAGFGRLLAGDPPA